MKKIYFKLNEKFKSFDKDFETELEGDLIILSGINGSGKSQIMNIIYGKGNIDPNTGRKNEISHKVTVDGVSINYQNIEFKSFKDNINLPEVIKSSSALINSSVDQAYNYYKNYGLASSSTFNPQYKDSCDQVIKLLGALYSPHNKDITEDVFKKTIRDNKFIWKTDDQFTDFIGNLFYIHATEIADGQQNAGKVDGPAFDPSSIGLAPWTELNQLFETLKLNYRFKDNYEVQFAELIETPLLFQIDSNGKIIETEGRPLKDLSDGEKTIISLCFTSLQKNDIEPNKLLLLDEFDAVLNPSLIESFFTVIEKYYISKGIPVILTTHSPATISLAPEYASFYEVFRTDGNSPRILQSNKEDYSELRKVNKLFYDKIDNQAERIKELETKIESNEDILIITEGKTDWKYILKALQYFHSKSEFTEIIEKYFYRFGSENDFNEKICGTSEINELSDSKLKNHLSSLVEVRNLGSYNLQIRIGIFDSDTNTQLVNVEQKNVYSFKIEPDGISTEFLFNNEEIKTYISGRRLFIGEEFNDKTKRHILDSALNIGGDNSNINKAGKRVIIESGVYNNNGENIALSKEGFAQAVFNEQIKICEDSWENFRHIFNNISKCITKE
ncbi:ABC-type multidrug transport system ATPase subunit [Flavobacterium nitrogenifigens]|uniref:ABC-type multidrug transport system ATPase subunit n=2 Tax=Flavobacterium TaxID=237 RepID=A0A7W7N809_9FLAO|nr:MULTISPECIES: AAA family ATPase [Flavobacterium]MBB4803343.1 ABC-type multidrug transport system ATPase subunit [Flavobacterium nitrogenifigens]MBB6388301.1 ABC-type multidrug transport system ATPase subunit [Flavobacterium notoginsengisoli]